MERGIGYNVSLSYISQETRTWMESYIRDAKPASMLMFDTRGDEAVYVKWLARTYPDTVFEYRLWIPDPGNNKNGDNQQLYLSAAEWVEKHRAFAGTRIYCTVNNEPNHGDVTRTCRWHIDVMSKAHAAGIRTAIGGYAYGHPNSGPLDPAKPENWRAIYGPYDAQMRAVAAAGNMAIVDIHEYGNRFLRDAVPYLIGRYKFWQSHLKREGIGPVRCNIGEHAWATIEADDKPEYWLFYTIVNSWNVPDWQPEMARQLKDIWNSVYADDPYIVGADLFTLADYAWPRSTYTKAPAAREMMRQGFSTVDIYPPLPTTPNYKFYITGPHTLKGNGVRVRELADTSSTIRATLNTGDRVNVISTHITINDGYGWQEVETENKIRGRMALHGSTVTWSLTPVATPPDDRGARLIALAEELEGIAAKIRAEAANA
jgi:hypothetical protein